RIFSSTSVCFIRDYHYVYHYGVDNTYAFIDWQELDIKATDMKLLKKITHIELYKIKSRKLIKKLIKKNTTMQDSIGCLKVINSSIAEKYLKLAKLNFIQRNVKFIYFYFMFLFKKLS